MAPSVRVEQLFRTGHLARATQQWRLEFMAEVMGVDEQQIVRYYGRPPLQKEPESVVYLVGTSVPPVDGEPVKIGYTKILRRRLEALQSGSVQKLYLLAVLIGGHELEREIHESLWLYLIREDWFEMCDEVRHEFRVRLAVPA